MCSIASGAPHYRPRACLRRIGYYPAVARNSTCAVLRKGLPALRHRLPSGIAASLALLAAILCDAGSSVDAQQAPPRVGNVTITKFKSLEWRPEDNWFKTNTPVQLELVDPVSGEKVIIEADDAEGSPTGVITITGRLKLLRPEGSITGKAMMYDSAKGTGRLYDAAAEVSSVRLEGKTIEILPEQVMRAKGATFTTCTHGKPDYRLTARDISVSATGRVEAHGVTFWLGGTPVMAVPYFVKTFRRMAQSPWPLPGYSTETGPALHVRNQLFMSPRQALSLDTSIAARRALQGGLEFRRRLGPQTTDGEPPLTVASGFTRSLASPLELRPALIRTGFAEDTAEQGLTLAAALTAGSVISKRDRTDIRVDRVPEVSAEWVVTPAKEVRPDIARTSGDGIGPRFGPLQISPRYWWFSAQASAGRYAEVPSHIVSNRASMRASLVGPSLLLSNRVYVRAGGAMIGSVYSEGKAYSILAPEVEANWMAGPRTLLGAAYRWAQPFGETPFLFDLCDVRHELRLRTAYSQSGFAADLTVKYDMERNRAYDTAFSIRRVMDCAEVGLRYETRGQSLGVVLNLTPSKIDHKDEAGSKAADATAGTASERSKP